MFLRAGWGAHQLGYAAVPLSIGRRGFAYRKRYGTGKSAYRVPPPSQPGPAGSTARGTAATPSSFYAMTSAILGKSKRWKLLDREPIIALPPLRCPGGPRMTAMGIKQLFRTPHAGFLTKYDHRFMLNLKLTHQVVCLLSHGGNRRETTGMSSDSMSFASLRTHDKLLIELGPGAGALTRSLLTRPCIGVLGVEIDPRFNVHLEQVKQQTGGKFQWMNGDVLKLNELTVVSEHFPQFAQQNMRRPPSAAQGATWLNGEAPSQSHSHGTRAQPSHERGSYDTSTNRGEDNRQPGSKTHGAEQPSPSQAPLRTSKRDELLRRRRQQHQNTHGRSGDRGAAAGDRQRPSFADSKNAGGSFREPPHTSPQPGPSDNAAFAVDDRWWSDGEAKVEVVANLPFSIVSELLLRYCVDCYAKSGLFAFGRVPLHVFTQKELAERLIAPAGSLHFSRLSVMAQNYFHIQIRRTFTEITYFPRTEVLGALVTLVPRSMPLVDIDAAALMRFLNLLMRGGSSIDSTPESEEAANGEGNDSGSYDAFRDVAARRMRKNKGGRTGSLRSKRTHIALEKSVPSEVAMFMMQELRLDASITVSDLTVEEIGRLALLWVRFLEATNQSFSSGAGEGVTR